MLICHTFLCELLPHDVGSIILIVTRIFASVNHPAVILQKGGHFIYALLTDQHVREELRTVIIRMIPLDLSIAAVVRDIRVVTTFVEVAANFAAGVKIGVSIHVLYQFERNKQGIAPRILCAEGSGDRMLAAHLNNGFAIIAILAIAAQKRAVRIALKVYITAVRKLRLEVRKKLKAAVAADALIFPGKGGAGIPLLTPDFQKEARARKKA